MLFDSLPNIDGQYIYIHTYGISPTTNVILTINISKIPI